MKPTSNKTFPCAVFGHNYRVTKENMDRTQELTCCHCNTVVTTDENGNFDTFTTSNSQIKEALQELYRLSQRISNLKTSA